MAGRGNQGTGGHHTRKMTDRRKQGHKIERRWELKKSEIRFMYNKPVLNYYYRVLHLGLRIMSRFWIPVLEDGYGSFDPGVPRHRRYVVRNLTGCLYEDLVHWLLPYSSGKSMLFAGEPSAIKNELMSIFSANSVTTTGLEESDVVWDFEQPAPFQKMSFDIVYSQAMLEHLVNPFEHLLALISLVKPGGYVAVTSASFLFPYHRTPVHTVNVMPDLIEIAAERTNMVVVKKRYFLGNIAYLLMKVDAKETQN